MQDRVHQQQVADNRGAERTTSPSLSQQPQNSTHGAINDWDTRLQRACVVANGGHFVYTFCDCSLVLGKAYLRFLESGIDHGEPAVDLSVTCCLKWTFKFDQELNFL